ncbi:cytochrome c [Hydrogenobacter thermophilus]|uniref:c-type cytochrome n=1 Tax=Hydrogenobacter thermophilus TaxID=940 RepID=UPI0030FB04A3
MRVFIYTAFLVGFAFAVSEGQMIFENNCLRCHQEGSKKPLSYLKKEYKGRADAIMVLAKQCPWGRNLSDMEIEMVSRWIAGEEK